VNFSGCVEEEKRPSDSEHVAVIGDSNGNLHVVWEDSRNGNWDIYYTKLNNEGETIIDDKRITYDDSYSREPDIAIDSRGNLHIVWYDGRDGNMEVYYTVLDNQGDKIENEKRLTEEVPDSYDPALALDSKNNVHIVWTDWRDDSASIYYTKLDDNRNVIFNMNLTTNEWHSYDPSISIGSDDIIYVVWYDERSREGLIGELKSSEISYTKFDDDGNRLIENTVLTPYDDHDSTSPTIYSGNHDDINVVWRDNNAGYNAILYTKSVDKHVLLRDVHHGITTSKPFFQNVNNTYSFELEEYFSGGTWTVSGEVYADSTTITQGDVFIKQDGNAYLKIGSWSSSDITSTDSDNPTMLLFNVTNHVTGNGDYTIKWECTGGDDLHIKETTIQADPILIDAIKISDASADSFEPDIEMDMYENANIVWYAQTSNNDTELFYAKLGSSGNRVTEITKLTDAVYESFDPSIYLDSENNIHILWVDARGGDKDIYYMKIDGNGNKLVQDTRLTPLGSSESGGTGGGGMFDFGFDGFFGLFVFLTLLILIFLIIIFLILFFVVKKKKS
jgi:hypothetical protein